MPCLLTGDSRNTQGTLKHSVKQEFSLAAMSPKISLHELFHIKEKILCHPIRNLPFFICFSLLHRKCVKPMTKTITYSVIKDGIIAIKHVVD